MDVLTGRAMDILRSISRLGLERYRELALHLNLQDATQV